MYYCKLETCKYKNSDPAGSYLGSGSTPDPEMLDPDLDPVHPYNLLAYSSYVHGKFAQQRSQQHLLPCVWVILFILQHISAEF